MRSGSISKSPNATDVLDAYLDQHCKRTFQSSQGLLCTQKKRSAHKTYKDTSSPKSPGPAFAHKHASICRRSAELAEAKLLRENRPSGHTSIRTACAYLVSAPDRIRAFADPARTGKQQAQNTESKPGTNGSQQEGFHQRHQRHQRHANMAPAQSLPPPVPLNHPKTTAKITASTYSGERLSPAQAFSGFARKGSSGTLMSGTTGRSMSSVFKLKDTLQRLQMLLCIARSIQTSE